MKGTDTEFVKIGGDGKVRLPHAFREALKVVHGWIEVHLVPDGNGGFVIVVKKPKAVPTASLVPLAL